jgi:hypothetical protein
VAERLARDAAAEADGPTRMVEMVEVDGNMVNKYDLPPPLIVAEPSKDLVLDYATSKPNRYAKPEPDAPMCSVDRVPMVVARHLGPDLLWKCPACHGAVLQRREG